MKLFTAVGTTIQTYMTAVGYKDHEHKFSHVVQALDEDEAREKVIEYYEKKSEPEAVKEITIFDFIS